MAQDKTANLLVQALKLRRLSAAILREAEALEASVAPVVAAWDDPAVTRTDIGDGGKAYETANSAVNPKEEDELLDLIEGDKSAISDEDKPSRTKQNKGNNPFKKSKDKWSSRVSRTR